MSGRDLKLFILYHNIKQLKGQIMVKERKWKISTQKHLETTNIIITKKVKRL